MSWHGMGMTSPWSPGARVHPGRARASPFNETNGAIRYFAARDVRCSTAQPTNATLKPAMNSEAMSTIKEMHRCSCAPFAR